jgi:hypothetical protein
MQLKDLLLIIAAFWGVYVAKNVAKEIIVLKKVAPPFALISKEGEILFQDKRFRRYDLHVQLEKTPDYSEGWQYRIHLGRKPPAIVFLSQEGAVAKKSEISQNEMTVMFIGAGWGSPVIKSEFLAEILGPDE